MLLYVVSGLSPENQPRYTGTHDNADANCGYTREHLLSVTLAYLLTYVFPMICRNLPGIYSAALKRVG